MYGIWGWVSVYTHTYTHTCFFQGEAKANKTQNIKRSQVKTNSFSKS